MQKIWANTALTADGWQDHVLLEIGDDGRIAAVTSDADAAGAPTFGALIPAPVNLHSHGFQRAMAGLTEAKGPDPRDSFWTWRKLMFQFLEHLSPEDVQAISAFVQMQMLEAGYSTVCEFHYLHHQPGGAAYDNIAELSDRIVAAASDSGIGLTLLPVLYQHGGCDGRALQSGQRRFGNTAAQFTDLVAQCKASVSHLPHANIGVAAHSLRAVSTEGLRAAATLMPSAPLHMHLAEQPEEVSEVRAAYGARPVEWLLENHQVDQRWCLIHATQMTAGETCALARTGAVVGLCPITESSLGDGIFDGMRYVEAGGKFGIGSDSNIRISLAEELRTLEYSQRLRDGGRAMFATPRKSTGRALFDQVTQAGAIAAGRDSGAIRTGMLADLCALDADHIDLAGKTGDMVLDAFIFAGSEVMITDVWSAGRHLVKNRQHIRRAQIVVNYRKSMKSLMERL